MIDILIGTLLLILVCIGLISPVIFMISTIKEHIRWSKRVSEPRNKDAIFVGYPKESRDA